MRYARIFIALVATSTASPIVLHALWRPIGAASGAFERVSVSLLTLVAVLIPLACAIVFAILSNHPSGGRATQGAAVLLAGAAAIGIGATRGVLLPLLVPLAAVLAISGFGLPWVASHLPESIDITARRRRLLAGLWAALGVVVVLQTARLSVFMADPSSVSASLVPESAFFVRHACLGAYINAAELSRHGVANVYQEPLASSGLPSPSPSAIDIAPFMLEAYQYPPPFLLLPRLATLFTRDFFVLRTVWFAVQATLLAAALLGLARWIGGREGKVAALLAPLAWVSLPSLLGIQLGNFQISAIALSVLAMVAFENRRPAIGGALLAFSILSKLWPGLLVIYLLAQRRWRDAAWVLGFAIFLTVASLIVLGPGPFVAFVSYQVPRLASGEAFGFMGRSAAALVGNYSVFGIPLKLSALGVPGMSLSLSSSVTWCYTVLVLALAVIAARRLDDRRLPDDRRLKACAWLALLSLGALRAPFAPGYVIVSTQWLMTLLAAEVHDRRAALALVATWLMISTTIPPMALPVGIVLSMVAQGTGFALLFWSILRRRRPVTEPRAADRYDLALESSA
ncbi:glycosyltransferase family 87 protein [Sorangium sp. So ce1036]|uniref:glycosyltransferase family 87 protein n=1 Tax=Sorangium sp. So ce1036 TaxID=3133328 RepID=UPI003F0831F6